MVEQGRHPARTYADLKPQIDRDFPQGQFVAVENGRVISDAATHCLLLEKLHAEGRSVRSLLIVQAGVDYPESAVILLRGNQT